MPPPIKFKIDVTKIDKRHLYHAKSGAIYFDGVAFELNQPGQYGDTHIIKQSYPKDQAPENVPIIGNLTLPGQDATPPRKSPPPPAEDEEDDIPF